MTRLPASGGPDVVGAMRPHTAHALTTPIRRARPFLLAAVVDDDARERWRDDLVAMLTTGLPPTGRTLAEMGFPQRWRASFLWP